MRLSNIYQINRYTDLGKPETNEEKEAKKNSTKLKSLNIYVSRCSLIKQIMLYMCTPVFSLSYSSMQRSFLFLPFVMRFLSSSHSVFLGNIFQRKIYHIK